MTSKVHLSCDGKGRLLSVIVTAGQRHESTQLEAVLDAIRVPRLPGAAGRPRKRPEHLIADSKAQRGRAVRKSPQALAGITTPYGKRALNYPAVVVIAALMIWLAS